jgi:hypothetical protein
MKLTRILRWGVGGSSLFLVALGITVLLGPFFGGKPALTNLGLLTPA